LKFNGRILHDCGFCVVHLNGRQIVRGGHDMDELEEALIEGQIGLESQRIKRKQLSNPE